MNIKEVKELIQEILRSDIKEFELEHTGTKVKLRRGLNSTATAPSVPTLAPPASLPAESQPSEIPAHATTKTEDRSEGALHFITSPIVGTFYRAPSPEAQPYVKIGDMVEEGSILCVVEAMKLMNEIPTDIAGEVVRICAENSQPVEFGQKLFGLRPRK